MAACLIKRALMCRVSVVVRREAARHVLYEAMIRHGLYIVRKTKNF